MDVCRLLPQPPVVAGGTTDRTDLRPTAGPRCNGGHDFKEEPCLARFDRMRASRTQSQAFGLPPSRPRFVRRQFWRDGSAAFFGPLPSSGSPQRSRSPGRRAVSSPFVQCATRPRVGRDGGIQIETGQQEEAMKLIIEATPGLCRHPHHALLSFCWDRLRHRPRSAPPTFWDSLAFLGPRSGRRKSNRRQLIPPDSRGSLRAMRAGTSSFFAADRPLQCAGGICRLSRPSTFRRLPLPPVTASGSIRSWRSAGH